jgi:hypothetical protein
VNSSKKLSSRSSSITASAPYMITFLCDIDRGRSP